MKYQEVWAGALSVAQAGVQRLAHHVSRLLKEMATWSMNTSDMPFTRFLPGDMSVISLGDFSSSGIWAASLLFPDFLKPHS